eukprot:TRINITY_DN16537_c0_g2_i1.p1 TRINITY_DN16537_c0_g2~~TRINITY_DN16537_c0_g2_i1.p1  ORF type:complete len:418 (+),score=46.65 TRINITY_DN16537_c0_g2_i1:65-1255(+)
MRLGLHQRRGFMTPPVGNGLQTVFSTQFRGRGMKKREQLLPGISGNDQQEEAGGYESQMGRELNTLRRMPDIDDPRPPIIGWRVKNMDIDGSLPLVPVINPKTDGRRILQGLYKRFKEVYNTHSPIVPLFGGGTWDPQIRKGTRTQLHPTSTLAGNVMTEDLVMVFPNVVMRGDLNSILIRNNTLIMEGTTICTDGHPRNVNVPGRVSRLNEGQVRIGLYCIIHPNCVIDSATIQDMCVVGEGSVLGYNSMMEIGSALEPGSRLLAHQRVPRYEVWGGSPARKVGSRSKDIIFHQGNAHTALRGLGIPLFENFLYKGHSVSGIRSSERIENGLNVKIENNRGNLPELAKDMISQNTREVPLWEEYKNLTRMQTRPGYRKATDFNYNPNTAKWVDAL